MNYCYHNKKLLSVTRRKLAKYVFVSILCFFSLFSFLSYVRGEESGGGDFANLIAESVAEQVIADMFTFRLQPVRLLSLHRGYFLSGWEKGQSLTVGYSFAIGAQGSHPFLFSVAFDRTYEKVKLEFSFWPFSFQFLPRYRLIRIKDKGGLVFGAGPIFSFSAFPLALELSFEAIEPPMYAGMYFMGHLVELESSNLPYVPEYNLRVILGGFVGKSNKLIVEGQFGFGGIGIFLLFGFALNISSSDYIIRE